MSKSIWRVYSYHGLGDYYAEHVVNGWAKKEISAHCLACAKTDLMAKTGELADIRGWHKQGVCGSFLKAMQTSIKKEIENNE